MHEWKVGDLVYAAMRGFCGKGVEISSAKVRRVGKGFIELSGQELAWRCRSRVAPTEVHPTRKKALEAFAKSQADHAEQCEAEARHLRTLAAQARKMAEEEP